MDGTMPSAAVRIPEDFYKQAQTRGRAKHRSAAAQVAYWAKIGKIAEENPDLPVSFIKDMLVGMEEMKAGEAFPYEFEDGKGP